jgi:hypothetical protein
MLKNVVPNIIVPFYEMMWKNMVVPDRPQIKIYGPCELHAGYQRLQTHTQNVSHLLLYHSNSGCTHALYYYVISK